MLAIRISCWFIHRRFIVGSEIMARLTPRLPLSELRPPGCDLSDERYRETAEAYETYLMSTDERACAAAPREPGRIPSNDPVGDNKSCSPRGPGRDRHWKTRPGDWWCAFPGCGAHNFNLRVDCYKCHRIEKVYVDEIPPEVPEVAPDQSPVSFKFGQPPPPPERTLLDIEVKRWETAPDPESVLANSLVNSHPTPEWDREAWRNAFESGTSTYVMRSQVEVVTCERNVKNLEINVANLGVKMAAKRAHIARMQEELKGLMDQHGTIIEKLGCQRMELYMSYKKSVTVCQELLEHTSPDSSDIPVLRMELRLAKDNLERIEHQVRMPTKDKRKKKKRKSHRESVSPRYSSRSSSSSAESRSRSRSRAKKSSRRSRRRSPAPKSRKAVSDKSGDRGRSRCEY